MGRRQRPLACDPCRQVAALLSQAGHARPQLSGAGRAVNGDSLDNETTVFSENNKKLKAFNCFSCPHLFIVLGVCKAILFKPLQTGCEHSKRHLWPLGMLLERLVVPNVCQGSGCCQRKWTAGPWERHQVALSFHSEKHVVGVAYKH